MPLIVKQKRAVVFKLKEPGKITTVIPTAKEFIHNGISWQCRTSPMRLPFCGTWGTTSLLP